jgi:hypothetical protein
VAEPKASGQSHCPGCGGIAQLVERLVRNEKVRGSNPLTSTILIILVKGFSEKGSFTKIPPYHPYTTVTLGNEIGPSARSHHRRPVHSSSLPPKHKLPTRLGRPQPLPAARFHSVPRSVQVFVYRRIVAKHQFVALNPADPRTAERALAEWLEG